jgi:uncharacterized damage-inducible protein DinB
VGQHIRLRWGGKDRQTGGRRGLRPCPECSRPPGRVKDKQPCDPGPRAAGAPGRSGPVRWTLTVDSEAKESVAIEAERLAATEPGTIPNPLRSERTYRRYSLQPFCRGRTIRPLESRLVTQAASIRGRSVMEITSGAGFAKFMANVRKRTLDVANAIPPEKEQWRLSEDSWSPVEVLAHIGSIEHALWGSSLRSGAPGQPVENVSHITTIASAIEYLKATRKDSEEYWISLSPEQFDSEIKTPTGHSMSLRRWIALAPEHEIHHRSFLHAYRKIWGLPSLPLYGLTYQRLKELTSK